MRKVVNSFSFLSVAYNHEDYIVEHLESIKFLVNAYGSDINCDLIINDDSSSDQTVYLIDKWLEVNQALFRRVIKLYNVKNIGTCASVANMLKSVRTKNIKLTACDDIYSFENIFKYADLSSDISIRSGIPLGVVGGKLIENRMDILSIIASDKVYSKVPLLRRFQLLSNNNAPNIIYNSQYVLKKNILRFLSDYDVVEDWPIQIALAENYPGAKFELVDKVFVYYRRTVGSTYIVAKGRFYNDKVKVYDYLIGKEDDFFRKILLMNRLYLFKLGNNFLNKLLNFSFYLYLSKVVVKGLEIASYYRECDFQLERHEKHYDLIRRNAVNANKYIGRHC